DRQTLTAHTATGSSTSTYTYPATGQTQPHGTETVTTTGATPASAAFEYDAAGNTTVRTVGGLSQALAWDAEGHLTQVAPAGDPAHPEATYVYGAGGDRLIRSQDGATTVYLPGGQEVTA
ncbi:MAG: hypothetical protein KQH57_20630, partial [Actinomycetales bacterium]|nr:hypothetical protein [Actinomycetales bacterium]